MFSTSRMQMRRRNEGGRRVGGFLAGLSTLAMGIATLAGPSAGAAQVAPPTQAQFNAIGARIDPWVARPRVLVLTDIANEPDDQMSTVRFLVYSNDYDIEGLVATTSRHLRQNPRPDVIRSVIDAYEKVHPNLLRHAPGFPTASQLRSLVVTGQTSYGMAAVGVGRMSAGAELIIRAVDEADPRPLWISVWGGANTLAQALWHVRETRTPEQVEQFVSKLRVYTISDQDDAGPWIRREFPTIHYIASAGDTNDYHSATWTGIAGDVFYRNGAGADSTTVSEAWINENIRSHGPLGQYYPLPCCMIEGDTPAFLSLMNNGLAAYMNPSFGGWGGRYVWRQPWLENRPYWTNARGSRDSVVGLDGKTYTSDQATIWRWREAFQHDFAARMDWTILPVDQANHHPEITVNGIAGKAPLMIDARVGTPVRLDAVPTRDPDGDLMDFHWFFYAEAGSGVPSAQGGQGGRGGGGGRLTLSGAAGVPSTTPPAPTPPAPTPPPAEAPGAVRAGIAAQPPGGRPARLPRVTVFNERNRTATVVPVTPGVAHVILAVTDDGEPSLTSYRRVILNIQPAAQ